jgi:hypothetical protein
MDGSVIYGSSVFPWNVSSSNKVFVQSDYTKTKPTMDSTSHIEVPIPDYTPMLIFIWNPADVTQYVFARVFSQGQYGNFAVLHNNGFSIASVANSKVTIDTDLGYNLSYKYIC